MVYKLNWHDRNDKPLVFESDVIVEMDGPNEYYIDHIKKNFDDWSDRVCKWAYKLESDESKDQDLRTTYEKENDNNFLGSIRTALHYISHDQSECKCCHSTDSGERNNRDKSKDVSNTQYRAIYHDNIRKYLSHIENGNIDFPISYYRRIDHIFTYGIQGIPVGWGLFEEDRLWE